MVLLQKQWLIMKRQHQCIFMDIYLQNLKETSEAIWRHDRINLGEVNDRNNWNVQKAIVYIQNCSASCTCQWNVDWVFSFPQWMKASMYSSHYTKTFQKYFIMIFSLQCSCLIMQHCTDSLTVHGRCIQNDYSWSRSTQ